MPFDFKKAEQAGYAPDEIRAYLAERGRQAEADQYYGAATRAPTKPTIRQDIEKRGDKMVKSITAQIRNEQRFSDTAFQILGQGAGFGNDLIARGISAVVPDDIEQAIGTIAGKISETKPARRILEAYRGFKQQAPVLTRNLEALGNIASLGTAGFLTRGSARAVAKLPATTTDLTSNAAQTVKTAASSAASKLAPVAEKSAEKVWKNVLNPTQRMRASDAKFSRNTPRFLAKEGLTPDVTPDGMFDPSESLDIINIKTQAESEVLENLLDSTGAYGSLDDIRTTALRNLDVQGSARDKAASYIAKEIDAYKRQYRSRGFTDEEGNFKLPVSDIHRIKKDLWAKGYTNPLASPDEQTIAGASRNLGRAARNEIEHRAGDLGSAEIRNLNRRIGELEEAGEWLAARRGAPIKNRRIGRYAARIMGGLSGSTLGPLGVLGGAVAADVIMDALQNPSWTLAAFKTLMKKAEKEAPGAVEAAIERIRINRTLQQSRPRLPAASTIPAGPKSDSSKLFTQPEIQQRLRELEQIHNEIQSRRFSAAPRPTPPEAPTEQSPYTNT